MWTDRDPVPFYRTVWICHLALIIKGNSTFPFPPTDELFQAKATLFHKAVKRVPFEAGLPAHLEGYVKHPVFRR